MSFKQSVNLGIAVLAITACSSSTDSIRSKVAQVGIGTNRAAAVGVMGEPLVVSDTTIVGIESVTLTWKSGLTTCSVTFVLDKAITKGCHTVAL